MNPFPIILCAGSNGRSLVYGFVAEEPTPGEPVRLSNARMILRYPSGGTLGLGADGPPDGSRVTAAVPVTVETVWQEWFAVTDKAQAVFDDLG